MALLKATKSAKLVKALIKHSDTGKNSVQDLFSEWFMVSPTEKVILNGWFLVCPVEKVTRNGWTMFPGMG